MDSGKKRLLPNVKRDLLPRNAHHLAWLDLSREAGQEYRVSMNLARDYAKACIPKNYFNETYLIFCFFSFPWHLCYM